MIYSSEAVYKTEEILSSRRTMAEQESRERLEEIRVKFPEIYRMNEEAVRLNYELISCIGQRLAPDERRSRINGIKEKNQKLRDTMHGMLEACGYPADYLQVHHFCGNCKDTGSREGVRCQCAKTLLKRFTTEELNSQCSIEMFGFEDFRADLYSDEPAAGGVSPRERMMKLYDFCLEYAENFDKDSSSLLFYGKTGLGKTFLSACIAKKLIAQEKNVVYGSVIQLLRKIEDERFRNAKGDTTSILLDADLLILDDLGAEIKSSFNDMVLYEIINERINNRRPTIISTNFFPDKLYERYNDRIVSRLTGCFMPCPFIGADLRLEMLKRGAQ